MGVDVGVNVKVNVNCEHGSGVWVLGCGWICIWIWVRDMVWMEMEALEWGAGGLGPPAGGGESDKDKRHTRRPPTSDQVCKPDYPTRLLLTCTGTTDGT